MLETSSRIQACSPRGPVYSGKFIARAVELYQRGVGPGYLRWAELQGILVKEFPEEFPKLSQGLPSQDTIMEWVRRYPDAPQRLRDLKALQSAGSLTPWVPACSFSCGQTPAATTYPTIPNADIIATLQRMMVFMSVALMLRFTWSLVQR